MTSWPCWESKGNNPGGEFNNRLSRMSTLVQFTRCLRLYRQGGLYILGISRQDWGNGDAKVKRKAVYIRNESTGLKLKAINSVKYYYIGKNRVGLESPMLVIDVTQLVFSPGLVGICRQGDDVGGIEVWWWLKVTLGSSGFIGRWAGGSWKWFWSSTVPRVVGTSQHCLKGVMGHNTI